MDWMHRTAIDAQDSRQTSEISSPWMAHLMDPAGCRQPQHSPHFLLLPITLPSVPIPQLPSPFAHSKCSPRPPRLLPSTNSFAGMASPEACWKRVSPASVLSCLCPPAYWPTARLSDFPAARWPAFADGQLQMPDGVQSQMANCQLPCDASLRSHRCRCGWGGLGLGLIGGEHETRTDPLCEQYRIAVSERVYPCANLLANRNLRAWS